MIRVVQKIRKMHFWYKNRMHLWITYEDMTDSSKRIMIYLGDEKRENLIYSTANPAVVTDRGMDVYTTVKQQRQEP